MRPYLAIIKDSFREALHSRVLWILLVIITLVLLAFAPLSFHEELTTGVQDSDVQEWPKLVEMLKQSSQSGKRTGARRFWELLDESSQQSVLDLKPLKERPTLADIGEYQRQVGAVVNGLADVLERTDLYDQTVWTRGQMSAEGRQLVDRVNSLSQRETARLNRILLEASFPGAVEISHSTSMQFTYAGMDLLFPLPTHKRQFFDGIMRFLPWFVDKFILSIGLLVAVLVTSPLIPQTFDPGSLHLLLSKPISRILLYLAKFAGGCAFVLLAAAYLFSGVWLIFGARLGIWEHRLLWCIPIYTFVFALYYSVAVLAGAWSRNTVVSIVAAILFWGLCFGIGVTRNICEGLVARARIVRITPAGDTLIVRDDASSPSYWSEETKTWEPVRLTDEAAQARMFLAVAQGPPSLGPVYDPHGDQLLSIGMSFRSYQFMVFSGQREKDWHQQEGVASPPGAFAVLNEPDGHVLIIAPSGVQRIVGKVKPDGSQVRILGFAIPLTGQGPLQDAGPSDPNWSGASAAGIDGTTGDLVVYSRGRVELLKRDSRGRFESVIERDLEIPDREPALVARGGDTVVVAREDGTLYALNARTLATRFTALPEAKTAPKALLASPDGQQFAALSHGGTLWLLSVGKDRWTKAPVRGQGDISAATFTPEGKLLVADRTTRITEYEPDDFRRARVWSPPLGAFETGYRYGIAPIYFVCPKPGELYKTVQYVLTDKTTVAANEKDLSVSQRELGPWRPVASGLAFMLVMLAIGSAYVHFQEF